MVNLYKMRMLIRKMVKVQWRIEQTEAQATKITTVLTGMPGGGAPRDRVQEGAIKIAELKEAYSEVIDELERMRAELNPLISSMEDANNRAVMRLRYIKGFSPEDIAEAIGKTGRSVYYYLSQSEEQLVRQYPDQVEK